MWVAELRPAILDHLADGRFRFGVRLGRRRRGIAAGHCVPGEAAVVREHVHDAPLGEGAGRKHCNLSHRRADVERGGQHRRGLGDELDLSLTVSRFLGGHGLGGSKLLRLVLRRLPLADVEQVALDGERPARLVQHSDGLLPHPDDAPVAREHAVAQADGLRSVHSVPLGEDLVPVVRVDEPGEEAGIREQLVGGVADEPVDLRADERRLPALERPDIRDDRQVLPERAVGRLGVAKIAGEPFYSADVSRDDDRLGRVRARDCRERGGEDVAITAPLLPDLVQPLPFADRFGDAVGLVITEQVCEWTADDLVRFVAVQRLSTGAPVRDDTVGVDAEDRVGRGGRDSVQPALGELLVARPLAPADRQPSDRGAGDEPDGKREQPGAGLVCDEEVVQQPANGGCGDRNGEHDDPRPSQVRGRFLG